MNLGPLKSAESTADFEWDGRTLELAFHPDSKLYDGRFANNSWLQEMPDPMTKLTWDNAALMNAATAEKLGVAHEDVVKLKFRGREVEVPVYVMPGQADGTVAVNLGYGRTAAGKVGGARPTELSRWASMRTSCERAMPYGSGRASSSSRPAGNTASPPRTTVIGSTRWVSRAGRNALGSSCVDHAGGTRSATALTLTLLLPKERGDECGPDVASPKGRGN